VKRQTQGLTRAGEEAPEGVLSLRDGRSPQNGCARGQSLPSL